MDDHLNPSIIVMRKELIKRKNKKDVYGKVAACGMCIGILPLVRLFFIRNLSIDAMLDFLVNPLALCGILLLAASLGVYKVYYEKAKTKYDALREELMSKIWYDFCDCWTTCDCKENFLQEMKKVYDINLYWK